MNESRGIVVTHFSGAVAQHQRATIAALAREIAGLTGRAFGGEYDPHAHAGTRRYFVPSDTLGADVARSLGIRTPDDLFGGVVPHPFVATKSIVHPLVGPDAHRPTGWSSRFAEAVREAVLPGFTAFASVDARRAARELLRLGPVRLKAGQGMGGHGQAVVPDEAALEPALALFDGAAMARYGLAVELDLETPVTYSVGQVWVDGERASYCGLQRATTDNTGRRAFGGSDLVILRGDFAALGALRLEPQARRAIAQARQFDAATSTYPGFFASRRNYDVLRGRDRAGRMRSGVLEQSWRIGGASGPEIAALAALRTDPTRVVRARAVERYGVTHAPEGAIVHFGGVDRQLGPLVKYTLLEPDAVAT